MVKDVFPDIEFKNEGYEELKTALRNSFKVLGYIANENQVKKAIQLYEQLQQRMGVVIVGPSGSGKTTLFTILKHALTTLNKTVKQHTMNPKGKYIKIIHNFTIFLLTFNFTIFFLAIPRTQLLGHIDLDTRLVLIYLLNFRIP